MKALAVIGIVALLVGTMLLEGWVLLVMWGWFVVPAFHLPALSLPAAMGLALLVSAVTHQLPAKSVEDAAEYFARSASYELIKPLVVLSVGWCIKGLL